MKKTLLISFTLITGALFAQDVNIPDANFKAYLVGNTSINTNMDTEIQVSEAAAYNGTLVCSSMNISDLTGVEEFTNITELICSGNQLASLDVSSNLSLMRVWCQNNSLVALTTGANTVLDELVCSSNQLSSFDITQNTGLTYLKCDFNNLTSLDVTQNVLLDELNCYTNYIATLDVSQNTQLNILKCYNNQLSALDVNQNTLLDILFCGNNSLTTLDISLNTALTEFKCQLNDLTNLFAANGNNMAITNFDAADNPNLTCIEVDDAAWSTANWTDIDPTASFDENCCSLNTTILVNGITLSAQLNTMAYQWIDCDNGNQPIPGATDQSFTPTANGNYACIVDNLICSSTSDCIEVNSVGLMENTLNTVSIYPNPASETIGVQLTQGSVGSVKIFSMTGNLVAEGSQSVLDVSELKEGVYFVTVANEEGLFTSKFIKKN